MAPSESDVDRIANRYPVSRRPWLIPVIALPLIALVAYWIWVSAFHANPALTADVIGFEVTSPTEIQITLIVDRSDPSVTGRCLVYAQAPDFERVGEEAVHIEAASEKVTYQTLTLRTFRKATSASVDGCVAA